MAELLSSVFSPYDAAQGFGAVESPLFPWLARDEPPKSSTAVRTYRKAATAAAAICRSRESPSSYTVQHKANSDQCSGPTPKEPSSDDSGKTHSSTAETGFMVVAGRETEDRPSAPKNSLLWYV